MSSQTNVHPLPSNAMRSVDVDTLLGALEMLEEQMAELYRWLTGLYASTPAVAEVFRVLCCEEHSHTNLVRLQRQFLQNQPARRIDVPADVADLMQSSLAIEQLRLDHPHPTLGEAIQLALEMKRRAAENHHRTALCRAAPDLASLAEKLAKADEGHLRRLTLLAESYGVEIAAA